MSERTNERAETTERRARRPRWSRGIGGAVVVAFLIVSVGCPEPFDPYWRVDSYRILGISSDPVALKPGDVATLSVLDYRPEDADVTYKWSWCPVEPSAQQEFECPLSRLESRSPDGGTDAGRAPDVGGPPTGPPALDPSAFELGNGETAQIPYPGTREQVVDFCRRLQRVIAAADQQSQLGGRLPTSDCSSRFEVAVRLEAETDDGTTEVAKKDIQLWTGGEEPNENPAHEGVSIRISETSDIPKARRALDWVPSSEQDRSEQWHAIPEDEVLPVLGNMSYDVRVEVGQESVETYLAPPPAGSDTQERIEKNERLTFRWFLSAGTIEQAKGIHIPDRNELDELRETVLTVDGLPSTECDPDGDVGDRTSRGPCDIFLGSVVRDDRDGLSWKERRLRVVGTTSS